MKSILIIASFLIFSQLYASPLWLRYPSISPDGTMIAFNYQGDIFLVKTEGGIAKQLTSNSAYDYMPIWSHDNSMIAFSSNRNGNFDVYLTDINGSTPKRLTFYSANDIPTDFTVDNKSVIFTSNRLDHYKSVQFPYGRLNEMYQVNVEGGRELQLLTIPGEKMKFNEKGNQIIFQNKKGYENNWRKHHKSSVTRDLITYNFKSKKYTQLTDWNGEDRDPVFGDNDSYYFLSEKSGTFNIWTGDLNGKAYKEQLTNHKNHPVRFLSRSNSNTLCYSFDGELYTHSNGNSNKVAITIYKDQNLATEKLLKVKKASASFDVSPNGKEIAFTYRGDVFVTSIDYSTTKQITSTPGQERSVSFSPDGKSLIYAGERNKSWNIYQTFHKNENEKYFFNATLLTEKIIVDNGEETFQPSFSPNGKEIAFLENRTTIKVYNLKNTSIRTILEGSYNYSYTDGDQTYNWSPDSKWILAEFFEFDRWTSDIGLINVSNKKQPINLTQSGYGNGNPKFAMDGEMIYYSTNKYGNRSHGSWGAQSDVEAIFLTEASYQKFKLSKEEYALWKEENKKDSVKNEVKNYEFESIFERKAKLTIHSSNLLDFYVSNDGTKIIYLSSFEKGYDIWQTKFREKETKLVSKLGTFYTPLVVDSTEKNLYINNKGSLLKLDFKTFKKTPITVNSEFKINLNKEREYMFEHAWRQVKEKFYVEDLHGVNWEFYKSEYAKFLPFINNSHDFAELLSEILGELNASHTGARYGKYNPNGDQTGVLGCYYDEKHKQDGLKIVELMPKSPLLKSSKKIKPGTIIEKINGETIRRSTNYYSLFNRTIGKNVLITFFDPSTSTRWDEIIKPISTGQQNYLAYKRWVKNCEETVKELSNDQLGYIHITGMDSRSFRELFDKALGKYHKKKALIIDTRFNGGGWLHDDLATFLSGKLYMSFEPRGQKNMGGEPIWKWQKSSCVLMSEGNYSDAHLFPYTYKALGIGKLIGMPVPGTGTAVWWERMIDGATVFGIPQVGMRSVSEGYLVENHELQPDIKVNNEYSEFVNGKDQQLKAAIYELLKSE